jgi:primosomal protein N'
MLELSFNERVRRAVSAYDLAGGYYDSQVHWCDECGFVPDAQFYGICGAKFHYVNAEHTVECKYGNVDEPLPTRCTNC